MSLILDRNLFRLLENAKKIPKRSVVQNLRIANRLKFAKMDFVCPRFAITSKIVRNVTFVAKTRTNAVIQGSKRAGDFVTENLVVKPMPIV